MKSIPAALAEHLDQPVTTLATLVTLTRRDGVVQRYTDHDRDLTVDGAVFQAGLGFDRTAIGTSIDYTVDELAVTAFIDDDGLTEVAIEAGVYDRAEVRVALVNWAAPDDGTIRLGRYSLGEIRREDGVFVAELRGMTQALTHSLLEVVQPECRFDLGDARCTVPIAPPLLAREQAVAPDETTRNLDVFRVETDDEAEGTARFENRVYRVIEAGTTAEEQPAYDTTPGQDTVDGTAGLRAEEAWTRHAVVTEVVSRRQFTLDVDEPRAFAEGADAEAWFAGGVVAFESGANAGFRREIRTWDQDEAEVTLFLALPADVAIGDRLAIWPGCFKRHLEDCRDKFDNGINHGGFPHVPGDDQMMRTPDAQ